MARLAKPRKQGQTMTESAILDVEQIKKLLPHRAPMLLVEKLADIVPLESATGYKAVSINEPWFMGHFPGAGGDAGRADRGGHGPDRGRAGGAQPERQDGVRRSIS